jgi:glutaredoxin
LKDIVLYYARDCHLCEQARETLLAAREEFDFRLREVDIGGDEELEDRYRVFLPVVEIDGERVFVFEVDADELRRRLAAVAQTGSDSRG